MKIKSTFLLIIVSITISCKTTKSYYFNEENIPETKVYKFVNENDENDIVYWEMYYTNNDTLVTNTYNSKLLLQNEFIEVLGKSNSRLIKYTSYYEFHEHPVKATVSKNLVFNWSDKEQAEYKVDFQVKQDKITITKKRKYLSNEEVVYNGRKLKTKKYEDTYYVDINSVKQEPSKNISYYAEGLGVIQFNSHTISGVDKMILESILTEKEFKKLKTYR